MTISAYTTDLNKIHDALLSGNVDDVELIGNALTALVSIVHRQQKEIDALKKPLAQKS